MTAVVPPPAPPRGALDVPVLDRPEPAVLRYKAFRKGIAWRVGSLLLSGAIWGAIWWFSKDNLWEGFWWLLGISMGVSVAFLVLAIVRTVLAKRDLNRMHEGLALGIGRDGLYLDGFLPWGHVRSLEARTSPVRGSVQLVVTSTENIRRDLPLEWLSASPASVDNAVRAMSGRRFALDLTRFDRRPRRPRKAKKSAAPAAEATGS